MEIVNPELTDGERLAAIAAGRLKPPAPAETGSPKHNMRFTDELWLPAKAKAKRIGTDMTAVARRAYEDFLDEDDQESADRLGTRLATPAGE